MWEEFELARQAAYEPVRGSKCLRCVVCGRVSRYGRRWRASLIGFGKGDVAVYCQDCAEREFG